MKMKRNFMVENYCITSVENDVDSVFCICRVSFAQRVAKRESNITANSEV